MIRIRVHPNMGLGAYGAMGAYGPAGLGGYGAMTTPYSEEQLSHVKDKSNLQLGYERALFEQKLQTAELQAYLKFGNRMVVPFGNALGAPGLPGVPPGFGTVPGAWGGWNGLSGLGGFGMNGFGNMLGGMGTGLMGMLGLGSAQLNITNQTATGAANQSVVNRNVSRSRTPVMGGWGQPAWGAPYAGAMGYGGGWLGGSGLLNW